MRSKKWKLPIHPWNFRGPNPSQYHTSAPHEILGCIRGWLRDNDGLHNLDHKASYFLGRGWPWGVDYFSPFRSKMPWASCPPSRSAKGKTIQVDREEAGLPNQVASPKKTMLPVNAMGSMGFEVGTRGRSIASPPVTIFDGLGGKFGILSTVPWAQEAKFPWVQGQINGVRSPMEPMIPYTYACGSPTLKNRRKYMSLDQLFSLCKELKIMPDPLSSFFADIFVLLFGKRVFGVMGISGAKKKTWCHPTPRK